MNKPKVIEWILRLSLAGTYLYSGTDIFLHPKGWHWAVWRLPQVIQSFISSIGIDNYLKTQAFVELLLSMIFLSWFLPKRLVSVAGFFAALQMFLILVFIGFNLETFRDITILGTGLALFALTYKNKQ